MVITICMFFAALYLSKDGSGELFSIVMLGATPYKLFLEVPWAKKQLASFHLQDKKKGGGREIRQIVKLG
jgi:hypothetical protein